MPAGRPTIKTPELLSLICERISTSSRGLHAICKSEDMPGVTTVMSWLNEDPEFQAQYARAREAQADFLLEEMMDIADDGSNDFMTVTKGDITYEMENKEVTSRSKIRVDLRRWAASKLAPKKYGDKMEIDHTVSDTRKSAAELFPDALDEAGKGE